MSQTHVPKALRDRVAEQARRRCGYCLTAEAIVGVPMEVDHIMPEALGGRLFNPRTQVWPEHFAWSEEGDLIVGLTPTGRATVVALNLNRPSLVKARQLWVSVGWHPPKD